MTESLQDQKADLEKDIQVRTEPKEGACREYMIWFLDVKDRTKYRPKMTGFEEKKLKGTFNFSLKQPGPFGDRGNSLSKPAGEVEATWGTFLERE